MAQAVQRSLKTGRRYDGDQILILSVPAYEFDSIGCAEFRVHFEDASRGISGYVNVMMFDFDCDGIMNRQVLQKYDAGNYELASDETPRIKLTGKVGGFQ